MSPAANKAAYAAWMGLWFALAALVWMWAVPKQLERGCWLGEWPFEEGCADWPTGGADKPPEVYIKHLERSIGDGRAWARLTYSLWTRQDSRALAVLPWAKKFAPYNAQLLAVQAEAALQAKDWPTAAEALVTMVERGLTVAVKPLTAMMVSPQMQEAVLARLNRESRWLDTVLVNLDPKVPPLLVQRFVGEGSQLGVLRPETVLRMVDRLKQSGNWVDAYTLWVAFNGKVSEGLFNAGFDQRSMRRGFDWEWPDPAAGQQSLRIAQTSASPNPGYMMELEMIDRAALPQPMLSQTVLLFGSKYRLSGQYMSDRLRTSDGLVWALRCADGGERWAQTAPLKDTQRKWLPFDVVLTVPPQCGAAVRLQLEAASPGEARAGMAGLMYFDDFVLEQVRSEGKG